jgi:nicotinamidase-related amidase
MPVELSELVDPGHTAVVTSEVQNGVIGDAAPLADLGAAARKEAVGNIARLVRGARAAGVPVVHGLAWTRADGRGMNMNSRLFAATRKLGVTMEPGSFEAAVLDEIGTEPSDILLGRFHGLNPMGVTDLDPVLRNLGVTTIVVAGVSVNVAITNLIMDAVNRGFQVVMPRDAVAGVPKEYADLVIDNTLVLLSTVTTTDAVLAAWGSGG